MIHDLVPLHHRDWVTARTYSMHSAQVPRCGHLRHGLRQLGVHGPRRGRDARRRPGARARRASPASRRRSARDGRARRSRRAVRAHRCDARAAEEPAGARRGARAARRPLPARRRRRRGLGRAAARSTRPGIVRLGRQSDERARTALPRRGRRRLSVPLRRLRHPDRRGDGERCAGRRLVARVARRGGRATSPCGPTPDDPAAWAAALVEAAERRDELGAASASSTRGSSPGGASARRCSRPGRTRGEGRLRRLAARSSTTPARRATSAACCARARSAQRRGAARARVGRQRPRDGRGARRRVVPARRCRSGAPRTTSSTARRSARRSRAARRSSSRCTTSRAIRFPELFTAWTRLYARTLLCRVLRARRACSPSPSSRSATSSSSRACPRSGSTSPTTRPTPRSSRRTARPQRATTCSPSGRSSRARTSPRLIEATATPRASSCGSPVRGAGAASTSTRRTSRWLGRPDDDELATAAARCALPRLPVALGGVRHPRARGDAAAARPVVTSAGSAMAEVAGGAAELVDPRDVESIAAGIERALGRRDELRRGRARARRRGFTWAATAEAVVASLRRAIA